MIKKEPPKEAVARWVSKYDDDYCPPNVHEPLIFTEVSHIEDKLTFDIEDLRDPDPILIQAPTGFGKTWWIINAVLPVVVQLRGRMLIASNRTAASIQQKIEVAKKVEGKDTKWAKKPHTLVIKDWEDFGPVKVMTLQRLNEFLKTEEGRAYAKKVSVVVLDECHYFTSDSPFNRNTAELLDVFPELFKNAKRIYLSATPEDVIPPLAEKELQVPEGMTLERMESVIGGTERRHYRPPKVRQYPCIKWYKFVSDKYAGVPVRYFKENNELTTKIMSTGSEGWLIFVQSKQEGQELERVIGPDACFISADSKDSQEWQTLVSEERLPCRVLIATSVLDCGVNINDDNLLHVAVPYADKAMFIQALGRKRFKKGQKFTLYVHTIDVKRLNGLMKQNRDLISLADKIAKSKSMKWILDDLLEPTATQAERSLIYLNKEGEWTANYLYIHKLYRQKFFYKGLKEAIDQYGDSAFPRLVHQWLGQPDAYDDQNWIGESAVKKAESELEAIIAEYNGTLLSKETDQQEFGRRLDSCYFAICGKVKRTDRKGGKYGHVQLNHILAELGIRGTIEKIGKKGSEAWVLKVADNDLEVKKQ